MATNIHLRGVDEIMIMQLKQEASTRNISVNQFILILLRSGLGISNKPVKVVHHDFDKLAGTWSKRESQRFLKSIEDFEKIDEDIWL